jgi:alkyl hydroperoxide reductase subunit AhpF
MSLLTDDVTAELREAFAGLVNPVRLAVFSQALAEPVSEEVRRLVEELAALDPRLSAESRNFVLDQERVDELGIERIPAIAVLGEATDYGVRLYGLPTGYEFGSLVEAVLDVSRGSSGLAPETRDALATLETDVRLRVFSTPT